MKRSKHIILDNLCLKTDNSQEFASIRGSVSPYTGVQFVHKYSYEGKATLNYFGGNTDMIHGRYVASVKHSFNIVMGPWGLTKPQGIKRVTYLWCAVNK